MPGQYFHWATMVDNQIPLPLPALVWQWLWVTTGADPMGALLQPGKRAFFSWWPDTGWGLQWPSSSICRSSLMTVFQYTGFVATVLSGCLHNTFDLRLLELVATKSQWERKDDYSEVLAGCSWADMWVLLRSGHRMADMLYRACSLAHRIAFSRSDTRKIHERAPLNKMYSFIERTWSANVIKNQTNRVREDTDFTRRGRVPKRLLRNPKTFFSWQPDTGWGLLYFSSSVTEAV